MTVRVRFAPSPTGELHIGSVRTTLYNWFFARHYSGTLILRIEDTDQERYDPKALPSIYEGLRWIGIAWDEGPREGGPHAPYVQSQRLATYTEHAERLVGMGAAYYCFCSKVRLEQVRAAQQARGEITKYDRFCRRIDPAEAAARAQKESHVVRLKVPDEGSVAIEDLVHGHVEWPLATVDDQILLKSDGFPTYQLAVVVDDHLMGITHVLRGDEWLPSTPKHLLVYRAFRWDVPQHGHLPSVLGLQGGKKLSKREGATRVTEFRELGYLPEALVNYLSLIGWAPGTEEEVFTAEDLIRVWRIEQVQKGGGRWDPQRLDWFNGVWIRRLSDDELLRRLEPFLPAEWDRATVRRTIPLIKERIVTLVEARDQIAFLFSDRVTPDPAQLLPKGKSAAEARSALGRAREALSSATPFDHANAEAALKRLAADLGWKQGEVNMGVRVAVTGTRVGPPLYESLELLGRERALARIASAEALLAG
ncbi:MAG: glutamate--tRNA ligase [Chloroflexi bacterium]|nr:glutamate--tRNA ligase [Chloroflexota bacterium]